jgi:hypothetical protein
MSGEQPIETDVAVVAMLDVLGARVHDAQEAVRIADSLCALVETARVQSNTDRRYFQQLGHELPELRLRLVGDAIVMLWPQPNGSGWVTGTFLVRRMGRWTQHLVWNALEDGLALRGAVGVGNLILKEKEGVALGSAVTDAATWYEAADWIGVVASPRAGMVLEHTDTLPGSDPSLPWFAKVEVPLKSKSARVMWAASWPFLVMGDDWGASEERIQEARAKVARSFVEFEIPDGSEQKYANALSFFDEVVNQFLEHPMRAAAMSATQYRGDPT